MHELPATRASLLLELGKHSDHAWAEFVEVYEQALYRFCLSKGLQDADARDAVQEVLAAVSRRLPSWDADPSRGSFRGWLFRVARNISVDLIARRARARSAGGSSLAEQVIDSSAEETAFDLTYRRSLFEWAARQVQDEVQAHTWQAFARTAIRGEAVEQVAADLGTPVGSVYTAKCRVMARIRSRIEALQGETPSDP